MQRNGKIVSWNDHKGYGFITPTLEEKQIFIHISAFNNKNYRPQVGQDITYSVGSDKQGRPCVIKATLAGERLQQDNGNNGFLSIMSTSIFFIIVAFSVLKYNVSYIVFILYITLSMITYSVYQNDKSAALIGTWRTSEIFLHFLSLIGGWPGAMIAQQKLRHKSQKQPFRSVFWITVLLNCSVFVWLFTPIGSATLQSMISNVNLM